MIAYPTKMSKLSQPIPFELHLTVSSIGQEQEAAFADCCRLLLAKPMIIELAQGQSRQQPMLNKIIQAASLETALAAAHDLSEQLGIAGFPVIRTKIEIPAHHASLFNGEDQTNMRYFEWHGKITYEAQPALPVLCASHKAHLSRNALKHDPGKRFLTLRVYGSAAVFGDKVNNLCKDLVGHGITLLKQQAEYCLYDNLVELDAGWLPE